MMPRLIIWLDAEYEIRSPLNKMTYNIFLSLGKSFIFLTISSNKELDSASSSLTASAIPLFVQMDARLQNSPCPGSISSMILHILDTKKG